MAESVRGGGRPPVLKSRRWAPLPDLGEEPSLNISGIACRKGQDGRTVCLVVYDEKRHAAFLDFDGERFRDPRRVRLLEADPSDDDDADLEAVAFSDGDWWVFGSHSRKKKETGVEATKLRPSRRHLYRFPAGRARAVAGGLDDDGRPHRLDMISDFLERLEIPRDLRDRLEAAIPLAEGGINIEGATVVDGRMYFGFRAASLPHAAQADGALVLVCRAEEVFGGGAISAKVRVLRLGAGMGIRDLVALGKKRSMGFLVLAGASLPDDRDAATTAKTTPSSIWYWGGGRQDVAVCLGVLGGVPETGKPEALLVLEDDGEAWRVLVLCDGVAGGAPREYTIPRPRP